MRIRFIANRSLAWLAAGLIAIPIVAAAQPASSCRQQMWADARAVAADLVEIRKQIATEAHQAAAEKFADSVQSVLPALNQAAQAALEKLIVKLRDLAADDPDSGLSTASLDQIQLTNGLVGLLASAGNGSEEAQQILSNLVTALASLDGVSVAVLESDLRKLAADAQSCRG